MGQAFSIDLIDSHAHKTHLCKVTPVETGCCANSSFPEQLHGELSYSPVEKQIYLQTASTHGDTLQLSFSNGEQTFLGKFRLSFFDPYSHQAIFQPVGEVEHIPNDID